MSKGIEHIAVDAALLEQIRKDSPHIIVGLRKDERLRLFLFNRRSLDQFPLTTAEQIVNRFGIVLVIKATDEVDSVAALLFVLIEP